MDRVLAQARAELAELQLFATGLTAERVVMVAGLFADEKDDFFLFLLGHIRSLFAFELLVGLAAKTTGLKRWSRARGWSRLLGSSVAGLCFFSLIIRL